MGRGKQTVGKARGREQWALCIQGSSLECLIISKKLHPAIQRLLYSCGVNHLSVHNWINVVCLTFKLETRITVGPGRPAKGFGK